MYSLSGGWRLAPRRASSDPTPLNQPNKKGQPSAEAGEGRAETEENIVQSHMRPTQSGERMSQGLHGVRQRLCRYSSLVTAVCVNAPVRICAGGRSVMVVPSATAIRETFGASSRGPETLVLYRTRPIPRRQVGSGRCAGRVRYSCLKEAASRGGTYAN